MLYAKPRVSAHGFVLCVGLAVLVGVLAGCGGASNLGADNQAVAPAGDVAPQALDPAVVGTWMLIWGTQNGAAVAPRLLDNWWPGTTYGLIVYKGTGTWIYTGYKAGGVVTGTNHGTWTAGGGLFTLWEADTHKTYSGTYTVTGNAETHTFTGGGVTQVRHSVKIVPLSAHDAALVKTWRATNVWVNGVSKPISYLTGSTLWPKFARRFAANGTCQDYPLKATMWLKVPKLASKSWASGGGALKLGTGPISEAIYVVTTGQLTTWQLDAAGNTLKVVYSRYGAAGAHDARLLGTWHPVSVTYDGHPVPLAVAYGWTNGVNNARATAWADGTFEDNHLAGTVLKEGNLGTWFTSAGKATLTELSPDHGVPQITVLSYSLPTSSSVRYVYTKDGHTTVMIDSKDS